MTGRNNKRPGAVAKCIFVLIVLVGASFAWVAWRGLQKEPHGAVIGSDVLPSQAARAGGGVPTREPVQREPAVQH